MDTTLRPTNDADAEFLLSVYASTRMAELSLTGWSDEQKAVFCAHQFHAQQSHYRQHYPTAQHFVILVEGTLAGQVRVDHSGKEILIIDISLLPAFRDRGIGTHYLRELQREAHKTYKTLSLHVEIYNPAKHLYERLGFVLAEDKGMYHLMKWTPEMT